MKVFLTGHKGYIGAVLTPMLLERGHQVTGLDTDLFGACTFDGELTDVPEIIGDVRDVDGGVLKGFDAVITWRGCRTTPWATTTRR